MHIATAAKVEEERAAVNTPREAPREMASYEGAIDELDRRGWVDPSCVGIIGFSRTVYHVSYTLTHSKRRFRAATLADGMNGGNFQYIFAPPFSPNSYLSKPGQPSPENLPSWFAAPPGLHRERMQNPVPSQG